LLSSGHVSGHGFRAAATATESVGRGRRPRPSRWWPRRSRRRCWSAPGEPIRGNGIADDGDARSSEAIPVLTCVVCAGDGRRRLEPEAAGASRGRFVAVPRRPFGGDRREGCLALAEGKRGPFLVVGGAGGRSGVRAGACFGVGAASLPIGAALRGRGRLGPLWGSSVRACVVLGAVSELSGSASCGTVHLSGMARVLCESASRAASLAARTGSTLTGRSGKLAGLSDVRVGSVEGSGPGALGKGGWRYVA
jgi:hypothetical protein